MTVSPPSDGGRALMLIGVERELTDDEAAQVRGLEGIDELRQISL